MKVTNNQDIFVKYGVKVYEDKDIGWIKSNLPTSNFTLFLFEKEDKVKRFIDEILKDEYQLKKLPYRVFVEIPSECKKLIENDTLLKKRICILESEEFIQNFLSCESNDPRAIVKYLYLQWIKHLKNLANTKQNQEKFNILILNLKSVDVPFPEEVHTKYSILKSYFQHEKDTNDSIVDLNYNGIGIGVSSLSGGLGNDRLPNNTIVYRRHSPKEIVKKSPFYYEPFSGAAASFATFVSWPNEKIEKELQACLLMENAFLSLVILDERICKQIKIGSDKHWLREYSFRKFYPVGKFRGDKEVMINENLLSLEFSQSGWELKNKSSKISFDRIPLFLIHQGVLDKAFKDSSKENLEEKIAELKKVSPFVVVTSGRGKPENVPSNAKFVLLSDVMINFRNWKYPDKLGIIRLLMSLGG